MEGDGCGGGDIGGGDGEEQEGKERGSVGNFWKRDFLIQFSPVEM